MLKMEEKHFFSNIISFAVKSKIKLLSRSKYICNKMFIDHRNCFFNAHSHDSAEFLARFYVFASCIPSVKKSKKMPVNCMIDFGESANL